MKLKIACLVIFIGGAIAAFIIPPGFNRPTEWQYRIRTDGTRWYVQEKMPGWVWSDDVFGGYFDSFEKASNRVVERMEWNKKWEADKAYKSAFTNVAHWP